MMKLGIGIGNQIKGDIEMEIECIDNKVTFRKVCYVYPSASFVFFYDQTFYNEYVNYIIIHKKTCTL